MENRVREKNAREELETISVINEIGIKQQSSARAFRKTHNNIFEMKVDPEYNGEILPETWGRENVMNKSS